MAVTAPSTEFSIGTTARTASLLRTASSAACTVGYGMGSASRGLVQGAQSGLGECTFRAKVGVPIWHVAHDLTVLLTHYAALRTAPLISHRKFR